MSLDTAMALIIPGGATRDMNSSDMWNLLRTYEIVEQAKDSFLEREITFQEYIDLLETAQVNVDGYLKVVESNLETMRLI